MTPIQPIYGKNGVRILRNLKITEVSAVDRGAGRGVQVMLMKKDEPMLDINKALPMWNEYARLIATRDKISMTKAYDRALQDEMGRELFSMAKSAHNGGNQNSLEGAGEHEGGAEALGRMRQEHSLKRLKAFNAYADSIEPQPGESKSERIDRARRQRPDLWAKARGN